VFHGKGGYDWETVYNMPIWLRRYTFNEIKTFYDKEREEYERASGRDIITASTNPQKIISNAPKDLQKVNMPSFVSKIKSSPKSTKK
jgi:hypothetical protein